MKIPLFDLDGTLVKTSSVPHEGAFNYAFKHVYNSTALKADGGNVQGRIDNQIIIEILKLHGFKEENIKPKLKEATAAMTTYFLEHQHEGDTYPLPGVLELLKKLRELNFPLGLLTGNVEGIAWARVEAAGIKEHFTFGTFGDMACKRIDLIEIAKKDAEKKLGIKINSNDFVLIGDTPLDIKCAREARVPVIAVSTGKYSFEELKQEKSDLLVHTLEEKDRILEFLNN